MNKKIKNRKFKYKEFLYNHVDVLISGEYEILAEEGTFTANDKVPILHKKCGQIFDMDMGHFNCKGRGPNKNGNRCPFCGHRSFIYSIDEIKNEVFRLTLGEYEVLSKNYLNNKLNLKFRHNSLICNNNEFEMTWNDFKNAGHRCPECFKIINESKFVKYIRRFLEAYNIEYIREKTFKTLKSDRNVPLRFDFYLPKYKILIEYDGRYHKVAYSESEDALLRYQENDRTKDEWVRRHKNFLLIRFNGSISILSLLLFAYFIDKDSTTIEKYIEKGNISFIFSRVRAEKENKVFEDELSFTKPKDIVYLKY